MTTSVRQLRALRWRLISAIKLLDERLDGHRKRLAATEAQLVQMGESIQPIIPRNRASPFKLGELRQAIIAALSDREGLLSTREVARLVTVKHGMDGEPSERLVRSIGGGLEALRALGAVKSHPPSHGKAVRWERTPDSD